MRRTPKDAQRIGREVPRITQSEMSDAGSDLQAGYDQVAEHYATEFFEELKRKPFDCQLLNDFAESVRNQGSVCELGCGPGQVARYLKDRGVDMRGIDLSAEMVKVATRLNPDIPFERGDMLSLNLDEDSLGALVLFYSIIHIQREDVVQALREMNRVLRPSGRIVLSFHGGEGELHRDEWYGEKVSIDFRLFQGNEMAGYLEAAGFGDIEVVERPPYEFEYPTNRFYVFARKVASPV
jgi:SAM-dependent methyltransferase